MHLRTQIWNIGQHSARLSSRRYFDFEALAEVATQVTRNLNQIIDVNYYPVDTARRSNMRHRPIGMGVQVTASRFLLPDAACLLAFLVGCSPPQVRHAGAWTVSTRPAW